MKTLRFKTNLHCQHCIQKITPLLNAEEDIASWHVDLETSDKVLTVKGDINPEKIISELEKIGYRAQLINE
ncbi:MAG TPA: heavy-metal-associated domain-containing protein [Bacteroidales bacterium]|nr:heavy-metal-associated domain-containing protein [Bacteroidales bacterium]MDI9573508.1 heavy-metal-associated domain-containing protein [Bacteroidota bacterium]OQC59229.1 MAG: Heavy-metal-associated domain protein [Bacteroidetes bacterium ADurb.Bin012]MBP9512419.1 heavy-metal-associated domain-containing protein [Bacteroidales bacterium]MBP9588880.1 heavy-metal-associated domain-containing protein [Bacteroidales bacterium]